MSETNGRYPLEFKKVTDPEMRKAFSLVAPEDDTGVNANVARKKMQQFTIANQLLLALHRPVIGDRVYFHPGYAEAGLRGLQEPPAKGPRKLWAADASAHLEAFAKDPAMQEVVAASVAKYYHEIGKRAVLVEAIGDGKTPLIREYPDKGDRPSLDYFGASHRGVNISTYWDSYKDSNDRTGKRYLPIERIAQKVGWTIPGVEDKTSPIRDMILERLEPDGPDSVVDPRALFALSSIGTKNGEVPASEVFQTKDLK